MKVRACFWFVAGGLLVLGGMPGFSGDPHPPSTHGEAAFWLENMREAHGFSWLEISNATGWTPDQAQIQWELLRPIGSAKPRHEPQGLKVLPYALYEIQSGARWLVTAWDSCERAWGNVHCPCLHSDPQFPDCSPRGTVRVGGIAGFIEAPDSDSAIEIMERIPWRQSLSPGLPSQKPPRDPGGLGSQ